MSDKKNTYVADDSISHPGFSNKLADNLCFNQEIIYFVQNNDIHGYNTRGRKLYRLPQFKKDIGRRSIRYRGVKMWEKIIMAEIDLNISQAVFKHNLKRCLLQGTIITIS